MQPEFKAKVGLEALRGVKNHQLVDDNYRGRRMLLTLWVKNPKVWDLGVLK